MKMRFFLTCLLLVVAPSLALAAPPKFASTFKPFTSEAELLKFLQDGDPFSSGTDGSLGGLGAIGDADGESGPIGLGEVGTLGSGKGGLTSSNQGSPSAKGSRGVGSSGGQTPTNANITNNQEKGVDEGGIVKNIGNNLVVLRQGRLFAVDLDQRGQAKLTDSIRVALDAPLNEDVWYDEMLVKGDLIYVVGYRYIANILDADGKQVIDATGATEFASFRLNKGKLVRLKTMFIESDDYFTSANFASRMLDDRLVAYMPFHVGALEAKVLFPRTLIYNGTNPKIPGTFTLGKPLFSATDVYKSENANMFATFQTVLSCKLPKDGSFDCRAKAILDSEHDQFYVSQNHVYLWGNQRVVAFNLNTLQAAAHRAEGFPFDQFAFSEKGGLLRVVVATDDGLTKVLRLPLNAFAHHSKQKKLDASVLTSEYADVMQHRWIDDWYVAGLLLNDTGKLLGYHDTTRKMQSVTVDGWVQKIEEMPGVGALIAIQALDGLVLSTAQLKGALELIPAYDFEGAVLTEFRSHGFFFQPNKHGGIFGLPIAQEPGQGDEFFGDALSSVSFFGVQKSGLISRIGIINASEDDQTICEASCIDWYGNTRPVFLGDRIFALMGSEISEASITERTADPQAPKHAGPNYHLTEHGKRVALTFEQTDGQRGE